MFCAYALPERIRSSSFCEPAAQTATTSSRGCIMVEPFGMMSASPRTIEMISVPAGSEISLSVRRRSAVSSRQRDGADARTALVQRGEQVHLRHVDLLLNEVRDHLCTAHRDVRAERLHRLRVARIVDARQ